VTTATPPSRATGAALTCLIEPVAEEPNDNLAGADGLAGCITGSMIISARPIPRATRDFPSDDPRAAHGSPSARDSSWTPAATTARSRPRSRSTTARATSSTPTTTAGFLTRSRPPVVSCCCPPGSATKVRSWSAAIQLGADRRLLSSGEVRGQRPSRSSRSTLRRRSIFGLTSSSAANYAIGNRLDSFKITTVPAGTAARRDHRRGPTVSRTTPYFHVDARARGCGGDDDSVARSSLSTQAPARRWLT
jgi:hypothetical protein